MATFEQTGLMTVIDGAGNKYLMYPITKLACVDGLEEALPIIRTMLGTSLPGAWRWPRAGPEGARRKRLGRASGPAPSLRL